MRSIVLSFLFLNLVQSFIIQIPIFGVSKVITAGVDTTIKFSDHIFSLEILTSANATVTLSPIIDFEGLGRDHSNNNRGKNVSSNDVIPDGYHACDIDGIPGFNFTVTPASALVNASLNSGPLSALNRGHMNLGGVRPSVIYLIPNSSDTLDLDIISYNSSITVPLPYLGIYLISYADINASVPSHYGLPRKLSGGDHRKYAFPGFNCTLGVGNNTELNVSRIDHNPTNKNHSNARDCGLFFDIHLSQIVPLQATLEFLYDVESLLNHSCNGTLKVSFFNETGGNWQDVNCTHDKPRTTLIANTDHFSTWAIFSSTDDGESTSTKSEDPEGSDDAESENTKATQMDTSSAFVVSALFAFASLLLL